MIKYLVIQIITKFCIFSNISFWGKNFCFLHVKKVFIWVSEKRGEKVAMKLWQSLARIALLRIIHASWNTFMSIPGATVRMVEVLDSPRTTLQSMICVQLWLRLLHCIYLSIASTYIHVHSPVVDVSEILVYNNCNLCFFCDDTHSFKYKLLFK